MENGFLKPAKNVVPDSVCIFFSVHLTRCVMKNFKKDNIRICGKLHFSSIICSFDILLKNKPCLISKCDFWPIIFFGMSIIPFLANSVYYRPHLTSALFFRARFQWNTPLNIEQTTSIKLSYYIVKSNLPCSHCSNISLYFKRHI